MADEIGFFYCSVETIEPFVRLALVSKRRLDRQRFRRVPKGCFGTFTTRESKYRSYVFIHKISGEMFCHYLVSSLACEKWYRHQSYPVISGKNRAVV